MIIPTQKVTLNPNRPTESKAFLRYRRIIRNLSSGSTDVLITSEATAAVSAKTVAATVHSPTRSASVRLILGGNPHLKPITVKAKAAAGNSAAAARLAPYSDGRGGQL